ncbi:MAG: DUF4012 domain-containing protein [bacterium]|nr:DUF4012 domain-containing protein [Candidatus Jorgensenbacteria bacterium]
MKQKVSRNNIVPVVVDIKNPSTNYSWSSHHPVIDLRKTPMGTDGEMKHIGFIVKRSIGVIALIFVLLVAYEGIRLFQSRDVMKATGVRIGENFSNSLDSMQNLDPEKAGSILKENTRDIAKLDYLLKQSHAEGFMNTLGSVIPAFKESGSLVSHIASLNIGFLQLAVTTEDLKKNGFHNFQSDGVAFLNSLREIKKSLAIILEEGQAVKNTTGNLRRLSSSFGKIDDSIGKTYVENSALLYKANSSLDSLITMLGSENTRHLLLLFQNPAEIRPGGGFIGSYADLTIKDGQMQGMDVRDIYDPDGQFFEKIVPPYQLQTVSENWGARDSNWFFDFPTSAKTVISFLELSKMYSEKGITFDGAIAINIPVIQSMLEVTGPIYLSEYNVTIDQNNFLTEVQREVEAGKDKKAGEPKRILKILAPLLMEKMKLLDSTSQGMFIKKLGERVTKKDIMFYAKDAELASFIKQTNTDGSVFEIPSNFLGSYLAIVDANVAGGKTDALIKQTANANINIDTNGAVLTDLVITRAHSGGDKKDPWWNKKNQNFIQILTDPGSSIISLKGNSIKTEKPSFDYEKNKYDENPDLFKIDSSRLSLPEYNAWSMSEFGKTAFGTWFNTAPGTTSTLTMRYHNDNTSLTAPTTGSKYIFVYERQSGVQTRININISAPIGFIWKESGMPNYVYTDENPDARIVLTLELIKQ